jgi:hypothetical protein
MSKSPAIDIAKNQQDNPDELIRLSTGVIVKLIPVPITAIQEASIAIEDPPVPTQTVEGKDYPVENPNDPDYLKAKNKAFQERIQAGFDVMAMLGIELVDGLPEDDKWLKKLKFLEKRGRLDLSDYDLEDDFELEFVFKRFYAMGSDDWNLLSQLSGVTEEDIAKAEDNFRSET